MFFAPVFVVARGVHLLQIEESGLDFLACSASLPYSQSTPN